MFDIMGVKANLIQDYEMKDKEQGFLKRLNMEIPNVLSNFYPKEPSTEYSKLNQFYSTRLPDGINMYIVNLFDIENLKRFRYLNAHYDSIPPLEFLESFITQISPRDVLIARINIKDTQRLTEVLSSDAAKRIDLALIPHSVSKDFVTKEEKALSKLNTGWIVSTTDGEELAQKLIGSPNIIKANIENKPKELEKNAKDEKDKKTVDVGSLNTPEDCPDEEIIPGNSAKVQSTELDGKTVDTPDKKPPLVPDAAVEGPKLIAELTNKSTDKSKDKKKKEPFSVDDVDFADESRMFMDIVNEYRAVAEPRSSQYLREISFKRTVDGQYSIKVADILIDKRYPKDEEIKALTAEHDKVIDKIKMKESVVRQVSYMERKVGNSGENPYVGPQKCRECHEVAYDIWESSKHAHTLETLEARVQQDDERCLECHLTKWEQPDYYKQQWTFDKFAPELGCETCHGPGAAHIRTIEYAIQGNRKEHWDLIKAQEPNLFMKDLMVDAKSVCTQCHDKPNSPDFDFREYWSLIEHPNPVSKDPLGDIAKMHNQKKVEDAKKLREEAKKTDGV